jgi:hypothetical protein
MNSPASRRAVLRAVIVAAVLAAGLVAAAPAGANTYSWSVPMNGATQSASHLPGDPDGTGNANITANTATNQVCGTFTWSNIAPPVVFGHIHQGSYGQPEMPGFTINLFGPVLAGAPSGVSGCALVPGNVISLMASYPEQFLVVVHSQAYPYAPIRGQLGSGSTVCKKEPWLCMY